jgi:UDP-glucose 4-epimerase
LPNEILVLGATGFAGGSAIKGLLRAGFEVLAVSRNAHLLPPSKGVTVFPQPLDNSSTLSALLPRSRAVFHVASDSTPGSTASQPSLEARVNLLPTLGLLESLQSFPQVPLVYVSSGGATYAASGAASLDESAPVAPVSYYGAGKLAAEQFISTFARQHNAGVAMLRASNFYGPGQRFKPGFGVIPTIFQHMIAGTEMQIWGNGEAVRDYLFIDDFEELCRRLATFAHDPGRPMLFNVGTGVGTTINQLCGLCEQVSGIPLRRQYTASRNVDASRIVLDCARIEQATGWHAQTPLLEGLHRTWEWFRRNG